VQETILHWPTANLTVANGIAIGHDYHRWPIRRSGSFASAITASSAVPQAPAAYAAGSQTPLAGCLADVP
jgi:hypothetical protein